MSSEYSRKEILQQNKILFDRQSTLPCRVYENLPVGSYGKSEYRSSTVLRDEVQYSEKICWKHTLKVERYCYRRVQASACLKSLWIWVLLNKPSVKIFTKPKLVISVFPQILVPFTSSTGSTLNICTAKVTLLSSIPKILRTSTQNWKNFRVICCWVTSSFRLFSIYCVLCI